ncbi:Uncharacterized protein FWK35_00019496, partial [Aphis craccivora]
YLCICKTDTYNAAFKREKDIFLSGSESVRSLGRGKRIKKQNRFIDHGDSESDSGNGLKIYFIMKYLNVNFLELDSINDSPLKLYGHGNKISEENLINSQNKLKKISVQEFNLSSNVVLQKKPSEEAIILSPPSKLKKIDSQEVNYSSPKNNFILNNVNQCWQLFSTAPAVFDTQINIEKTNISTNALPELDHNNRNQDDVNKTSLNSGVEVLPPVKTTSMSNNLVSCLDNNEIDKGNISQMLVLLKNIVEDNFITIAYLKRLDGRLDKIEKAVRDVTYVRNNVSQLDDDFLTIFPISNIDCLKNIEEKIKNYEEFKLKLNNLVMFIDGRDVKNFVKRTATRLFSNDLSSKCSWYGHKNNFKLQNLGIINIMKEISKHYFKNTDIVFETKIKEWFRHGAHFTFFINGWLKKLKKGNQYANMSKRNFERIIESEKCSAYSNVVNITTATSVKQNNTIIFNNINDSSTTQILASTNGDEKSLSGNDLLAV